jgi:hypothetical protein
VSCSTPSMSPRRADRGHVLTADEPVAVAEELDLLGEELLQVRLDAVLLEARVDAELVRAVVVDLVDRHDEGVTGLLVRDLPQLGDPGRGLRLVGLDRREHAGRAHPVERLVGAAVGVDEQAAVVLHHEQPLGERQVSRQPSGIIDRALRNHQTHDDEPTATPQRVHSPIVGRRNPESPERGRTNGAQRLRRLLSRAAGEARPANTMSTSTTNRAFSRPIASPRMPMSGGPTRNAQ